MVSKLNLFIVAVTELLISRSQQNYLEECVLVTVTNFVGYHFILATSAAMALFKVTQRPKELSCKKNVIPPVDKKHTRN